MTEQKFKAGDSCRQPLHLYTRPVCGVLEPAKAERLTVGDYVTSIEYPDLGVAEIIQDDDSQVPYLIRFGNGLTRWQYESDVVRADPPVLPGITPRPTVGDYVTSSTFPEIGIGKIIVDDFSETPYLVEFSDGSGFWHRAEWVTHSADRWPEPPAPKPNPWRVASEPPDSMRNVRVLMDDGAEKYGWHSQSRGEWWSFEGKPPAEDWSLA